MANLVLLAAAGFLAYTLVNSTEPYVATPSSAVPLTADMIQKFIQVTKQELCKQLGYPVQPVETTYVRPNGSNFDCRFMFAAFSPKGTGIYSIGVSSTLSSDGNLVSLDLQNDNTIDQIDAFGDFQSGSLLTKPTLPTIAQLKAAFS